VALLEYLPVALAGLAIVIRIALIRPRSRTPRNKK
jgi:hypothetical protein